MRLTTLGELRLMAGGTELLRGRRKVLVLLAYLAAHSPRPVQREELAALFWGERDEAHARQSLRQALRELRGALGERIMVSPKTVAVAPGAIEWDAERFRGELGEGRLADAVEWCSHGCFLEGCEDLGTATFGAWLEAQREQFRRLCADALQRLAAEAEQRGEWKLCAGWLERWVALDPLSEPAATQWILALRLAGHPERATRVHAEAVARIRAELEMEPSAEFLRLGDVPKRHGIPPHGEVRSAALLTPDLIGRGAFFNRLADAWARTCSGGAATVLVEGEEGIGKTRLCEEFVRWVESSGTEVTVLRARAFAAEKEIGGSLMRDLLAGLAEASGLGGAPDAALSLAAEVVPAIRERFPRLPPANPNSSTQADAVQRVLGDVAAERPLLLFVDDLPAADDQSSRFALALARRLPASCLLLVTASTAAPGFAEATGPFHELGGIVRIVLPALNATETEALLHSMLPLKPEQRHAFAMQLHAETGGKPFYIIALVSALAEVGYLERDVHGVWRLPTAAVGALPLPPSIQEVVNERLRHLSPVAREVLDTAAVLGRTIDPARLEASVRVPADVFCDAVEELIARRLLRLAPARWGHYEFSHDLIRRVAWERLGPARQRLLQRSVHGSLESDPEVVPVGLAADDPVTRQPEAARVRAGGQRWRRAAATALLALSIGAAMGIAAFRSGSAPPVSASTVAVLPFEYRGNASSSYLGEGLADLLSIRLDGAYDLSSVDPRMLLGSISRAGHQAIDPAQGRVIAGRFGAGHFVLGSVVESRGALQVSAALYGPDGEIVATAAATAEEEAGVLGLVDDLARQLLTARYRGAAAALVQAAAVTTTSLPALKAYLNGERHLRSGRFADAATAFATAAEADTTFALAFYRLAVALEWATSDSRMVDQAVANAARQAHRLPARTRLLVEATTERRAGRSVAADSLYREVLSVSRADFEATFQIAEIRFHDFPVRGLSFALSKPFWTDVLAQDPGNGFALVHLARIAATEDSLDDFFARHATEADAVPRDDRRGIELALWKAVHTGHPSPADLEVARLRPLALVPISHIVAYSRDLGATRQLLDAAREASGTTPVFAMHHANVLAAQGRWRAAERALDADITLDRAQMLPQRALLAVLAAHLNPGGDLRGVRERVHDWSGANRPDGHSIRHLLLGLLDATAGDHAGALAHAADLDSASAGTLTRDHASFLRADVARREGRHADALRLLDAASWESSWDYSFNSVFHSRAYGRWLRAELLRESGNPALALRWYETLGQVSPFELAWVPLAHLRRAEIHDRRGERVEALRHYRRFAEMWNDADAEVQPLVKWARERIRELESSRP